MTEKEKRTAIESSPVLGYWPDFNGVEVRKKLITPSGTLFFIKANANGENPTYHVRKVSTRFSNDGLHDDNVKVYNRRLYIRDMVEGR